MNKLTEKMKLELGKAYFYATPEEKRALCETSGKSDRTLRRYRDLFFSQSGNLYNEPVTNTEPDSEELDFSILVDSTVAIITDNVKATSVQFQRGSAEYDKIYQMLPNLTGSSPEWEEFFPKPVGTVLASHFKDDFRIIGKTLVYKDKPVPISLALLLKDMLNLDYPDMSLFSFLEKIHHNPSAFVFNTLYDFLVHTGTEINAEGDVIAYKAVREDLRDIHSGTIVNNIGAVISMERSKVDELPENTCSYGLHVGSLAYARKFGGSNARILQVKIDPADFVTVPFDYSGQKARVCKYTVMVEVSK